MLWLRGLLLIALSGLPACAARINEFTVRPHEVCGGTPVKVDWSVRGGSAKVTARPQLSPQSGTTYIPTTTTQFILSVEPYLGRPKLSETEATVYTGTASQPEFSDIAFTTTCQGGRIVATAERSFAEWDPRLTVGSVEAEEDRDVTLSHEGREVTLTAQQPSTQVFDGTKLAGTWSVAVPLLSTESCDGTGEEPPDLIIVTAHVRCEN